MSERTDTDRVDDLLSSGVDLYSDGRVLEAAEKFEAVLEIDPDEPRAQKYLADARAELGIAAPDDERAQTSPVRDPSIDDGWFLGGGDSQATIARKEERIGHLSSGVEVTDEPTLELPTFRARQTNIRRGSSDFDVSDAEPTLSLDQMELRPSEARASARSEPEPELEADAATEQRGFAIADFELEPSDSAAQPSRFELGPNSLELGHSGSDLSLEDPLEETVERRLPSMEEEAVTVQRHSPIDFDDEIILLGEAERKDRHDGSIAVPEASPVDDELDLGLAGGAFEKEETKEFSRTEIAKAALFANEMSTTDRGLQKDDAFALSVTRTLEHDILAEIDADAPADENSDEAVRRRVSSLLERALMEHRRGRGQAAVVAASLAIEEAPESVAAQKLIHGSSEEILGLFASYLGNPDVVPSLARPLDEITEGVDARDAFLLSRVDGLLTVGDIIDVSGMPSLESYRILCRLLIDGIIHAA